MGSQDSEPGVLGVHPPKESLFTDVGEGLKLVDLGGVPV